MWISDYVTRNSFSSDEATRGEILFGDSRGVAVSSSNSYFNLPQVTPYGVAYVPVSGAQTVVLPADGGGMVLGVVQQSGDLPDIALQPGELMLYSAGGATLVLKNDGTVQINGRTVT